jgi:hypothetical protein
VYPTIRTPEHPAEGSDSRTTSQASVSADPRVWRIGATIWYVRGGVTRLGLPAGEIPRAVPEPAVVASEGNKHAAIKMATASPARANRVNGSKCCPRCFTRAWTKAWRAGVPREAKISFLGGDGRGVPLTRDAHSRSCSVRFGGEAGRTPLCKLAYAQPCNLVAGEDSEWLRSRNAVGTLWRPNT